MDAQIEENATDYIKLSQLFDEKSEVEKLLEEKYIRWDKLSEGKD